VETPITRTAGIPYTQSIVGSKEAPDPGQILVKLSMPSNVPIEKVEDMAMALVHQYMQQMSDLYQEFIVEYDPGGVRLMEEPKI
jgi:hypothetical protein